MNQLGLDPNDLTYFHGGLDKSLVGVEGLINFTDYCIKLHIGVMVMIKILTYKLIIIPFASARERFKTTEVNEKTKAYCKMFVYPQKFEVPNVNQKHPIDSFVIQKLQEKIFNQILQHQNKF